MHVAKIRLEARSCSVQTYFGYQGTPLCKEIYVQIFDTNLTDEGLFLERV